MNTRLSTALILFAALILPARADVTILSEDFEGAFPGQWSVGVAIPGGSTATWQVVNSGFGGVGAHGGNGMAFCAGTQPNYTNATADFSSNPISATGCGGSFNPSIFTYRSDGPAWAITGTGATALTLQFTPFITGQYTLTVTHLTSANASCQGGGYSPVTITANGTNLATCYDPAANHGGTHGFVTDSWAFDATAGVPVTNTWFLCGSACSPYWIQQLAITGPAPEYQNGMSAFMQRSINLTGCTNATLSFWHIMPSLDQGNDYGCVLIDGAEIWRADSAVMAWSGVQLSLNSYTGAWHVLRFEFDSNSSVWGRGWYLDDILVTTTFASPGQTNAPIGFAASDFPSQLGEYYRAYCGTNTNVATWIAQSGPAQQWDFSQPQQSGETIQRMDIVPPDDGGWGGNFPEATYAERMTTETNDDQSWSYYSLTNNEGRFWHGFYNPIDQPIDPLIVFVPPVLQFPVPVSFGQAWQWSTAFLAQYESVIELVYLTNFATVDSYGTLVVQGGLVLPTLRVMELAQQTISISGTNVLTATSTNYYWLVRGVGLAAQISCPISNSLAGIQSLRVFEASDFKDLLVPVNNLQLCLQDYQPVLNWSPVTGASGYRIESASDLVSADWQLLDLPSAPPWTNAMPVSAPQGFFRVFARP